MNNMLNDRVSSLVLVWLTLVRVLVVHGQQGSIGRARDRRRNSEA